MILGLLFGTYATGEHDWQNKNVTRNISEVELQECSFVNGTVSCGFGEDVVCQRDEFALRFLETVCQEDLVWHCSSNVCVDCEKPPVSTVTETCYETLIEPTTVFSTVVETSIVTETVVQNSTLTETSVITETVPCETVRDVETVFITETVPCETNRDITFSFPTETTTTEKVYETSSVTERPVATRDITFTETFEPTSTPEPSGYKYWKRSFRRYV